MESLCTFQRHYGCSTALNAMGEQNNRWHQGEGGGGEYQSRLSAELALIFLSESYMKLHRLHPPLTPHPSFLHSFPLPACPAPLTGPDEETISERGRVGRLEGGTTQTIRSLSAALGKRKGARSHFKAAVLAAIPALTLLDPSAHINAGPFLGWSAVPLLLPRPPLPTSLLLF